MKEKSHLMSTEVKVWEICKLANSKSEIQRNFFNLYEDPIVFGLVWSVKV